MTQSGRWPGHGAGPVSILLHRGHGPSHLDVVLGRGARCPTLALQPASRGGWAWRPQPAHRRRYLTWAGAVSGARGTVRQLWRGEAHWRSRGNGLEIEFGAWRMLLQRGGVVIWRTRPHSPPWVR